MTMQPIDETRRAHSKTLPDSARNSNKRQDRAERNAIRRLEQALEIVCFCD